MREDTHHGEDNLLVPLHFLYDNSLALETFKFFSFVIIFRLLGQKSIEKIAVEIRN